MYKIRFLKKIIMLSNRGDIFALVGPSGAGKSIIFKILTGKERATVGDVYVYGTRIDKNIGYGECIAYGTQVGGLADYLSGRDVLYISCLIRGVRNKDIDNICTKIAKYLGIKPILDEEILCINSSDRKKLTLAMVAIGNTSLIYLDQPTSGCAPAAKMKIWDFIGSLNYSGRTILFTSHNMEECYKLCTRIAVMVNGQIISIGSPREHQKLVQNGIDITVGFRIQRVVNSTNDIDKVTLTKRLLERTYPEAVLKAEHTGIIVYFIPYSGPKDWVDILSLLEDNKEYLEIGSYHLNKSNIDLKYDDLFYQQYQRKT